MIRRTLRIENELGLHARAAARLVRTAGRYRSKVLLHRPGRDEKVDGKSLLGILLLAASKGSRLCLSVEGPDEREAVQAIVDLVEDRFGEVE